jgi:hypothetical protein
MFLRVDDLNPEIFAAPPGGTGRVRFAIPGKGNVGEFLDYVEDMSLLLGCPSCRSFNVRELMMSGVRIQVCDDCGFSMPVPPAN